MKRVTSAMVLLLALMVAGCSSLEDYRDHCSLLHPAPSNETSTSDQPVNFSSPPTGPIGLAIVAAIVAPFAVIKLCSDVAECFY